MDFNRITHCAPAQSPFFPIKTLLSQINPRCFKPQSVFNHDIQCKPSMNHEFLWALAVMMSEQIVLIGVRKEVLA